MFIALTVEQIIELHDDAIAEDGGLVGVKDPGYVELIAEKPFQDYFGQELYPGLFMKAAVYFHGIATAHAFFDANKRTAVYTCLTFLALNGSPLEAEWDELFEVAIKVATNEMGLHDLADWIADHT